MRTVAVVGASLAGLSAARALRSLGFDGRVVMVGAEQHPPYDRPPLSKDFLLGRVGVEDLALQAADDDLDLDWRLGSPAVGLDTRSRTVSLASGDDLRADGVVLATGARARTLPGTRGLAGVHTLRTLDDAVALRESLGRGGPLVVVGAGFIGAEVASSARALGLDVTVVGADAAPLARVLGPDMGRVCAQLHADHGVRLLAGSGVAGFTGSGRVHGVHLVDGRVLPADVVVVGIGAAPNVAWLAGSGLDDPAGVRTGSDCATTIPGVVAAGDCAASYRPATGAAPPGGHWTNAREQGAVAAATLLSAPPVDRPGGTGYFWSHQYGVLIQFAGHRLDGDAVRVVEGDLASRSFVAAYERGGVVTAVLAMNRPRPFTALRRRLATASPVVLDVALNV
jgi:NADPH-dependent 2,4-dienoyl-CoA reductase/sulfur reductase-like enzyme